MRTKDEYEAMAMLLGEGWVHSASTRSFWRRDEFTGEEVHFDRDTMAPLPEYVAFDRASDHWHSLSEEIADTLRGKR